MKRQVCYGSIISMLAILVAGCSPSIQDKPVPWSQENIERFNKEVQKVARSIAPSPSPSQDGREIYVTTYKMIVEKKLGYSFDKSLRSSVLFESGGPLFMAHDYIVDNPKRALEKGYISQDTVDCLEMAKKANYKPLTKKDEELLGFIVECQTKNNGICVPKILLAGC